MFLDTGVVGGGLLQIEQVWLSVMKFTNNRIRLGLCDKMRKACIIQWPALEICRRRVWQALARAAGGHLRIESQAGSEQATLQLNDGRLLHMALPQQDAGGRWVALQLGSVHCRLLVSDPGWPQAMRGFLQAAAI